MRKTPTVVTQQHCSFTPGRSPGATSIAESALTYRASAGCGAFGARSPGSCDCYICSEIVCVSQQAPNRSCFRGFVTPEANTLMAFHRSAGFPRPPSTTGSVDETSIFPAPSVPRS